MTLTSRSAVTHAEKLGRRLDGLLGKKISVDLSKRDDLSNYIIKRGLYGKRRKYSHLVYDKNRLFLRDAPSLFSFRIEIQDIYLSDPALRSHTGSVTRASVGDIVNWATSLGLLNKTKFSKTATGQLLDTLTSKEDKEAFLKESPTNPYILKLAEMLFFLRLLIESDGDIIIPLLRKIVQGKKRMFNRSEAGLMLLDVYQENLKRYRQKARRGNEFRQINMLDHVIKSITKQVRDGKPSVGTKELRVTARLEPLVDLKILDKKHKFSFEYLTSDTAELISQLDEQMIGNFIIQNFFSTANRLYQLRARKIEEEEDISRFILMGYKAIKNPLGLASMEDASFLGSIFALQKSAFFEHSGAKRTLLNMHSKFQGELRLHIDKYGEIKYFVASRKIQEKFAN